MSNLSNKTCSVDNCERKHYARGYCSAHHQRMLAGKEINVRLRVLRRYGDSKCHPLYRTWGGMHSRCNNSKSTSYKYYGAKGVAVCKRWNDFRNFVEDMGERPEGMTLDRYPDKNGDYEPSNVRWATYKQQRENQGLSSRNSSGIKGISYDKTRNKWYVKISGIYLGRFKTLNEATKALTALRGRSTN